MKPPLPPCTGSPSIRDVGNRVFHPTTGWMTTGDVSRVRGCFELRGAQVTRRTAESRACAPATLSRAEGTEEGVWFSAGGIDYEAFASISDGFGGERFFYASAKPG